MQPRQLGDVDWGAINTAMQAMQEDNCENESIADIINADVGSMHTAQGEQISTRNRGSPQRLLSVHSVRAGNMLEAIHEDAFD
jgi:hypothetical protein